MANDKKLTIGSTFDSSGVDKVTKSLQKLKREGIEVAKAFKNISLGTSHGQGQFAKTVVDGGEKLRKFRGISEDVSKSLKTVLGKTIDDERAKLTHYTSRVETLSKAYQKQQKILQQFKEQGGSPYAIKAAEARSQRFGQGLIGAQASKESYADSVKELTKDPQILGSIMKAMGIVGTVGGAVAAGLALYQQNKTVSAGNVAAVGGGVGGVLGSLMSNPAAMGAALMGSYKLPDGRTVSAAGLLNDAQGTGAIYGRDMFAQGSAGAAAGAGVGLAFAGLGAIPGALIGGTIGIGRSLYQNYSQGGAKAEEAAKIQDQLNNIQGMNPLENLVSSNLAATAGVRLAAARRLGGQGMGIAGIGAGVGSDLGESLSLGMGLAEHFGARDTVGAQGYAAQALRSQKQGFGSEFTGNFLGSMGSAGANGTEVLAKILSQAVRQGMGSLDIQFFEKIGNSVARAAVTTGGAVMGNGSQNLAATLMGGITNGGSAAGMHAVDIRQSGLEGLDKLSRIPAVHFTKMALAKKMLGDNASGAEILALANASPQELIQGSRRLAVLGLNKRDLRMNVLEGGLEAAMEGVTGSGHSKEALQLQALIKKDGGFQKALKDPKFTTLAGTVLSIATGMTQEEGEGMFQDAGHGRDRLKGGRKLNDIHGGLSESQKITTAVQALQLIGAESMKTSDGLNKMAKGLELSRDAFSEFVKMFENVDINSVSELTDKLKELVGIVARKHPGKHPTENKTTTKSPTVVPTVKDTYDSVRRSANEGK